MPYVIRNEHGKVTVLTDKAGASSEFLAAEHPEVLAFLTAPQGDAANVEMLLADLKMIRVIEDLIDILISKNIIIFSELPLPVQQKILLKKGYRDKLFGSGAYLMGSAEDIL